MSPSGHSSGLCACCSLLLDLRNLLALHGGRCDLSAQNDVPDLALSERAHVDIVLLAVVCQDQILQSNLHLQDTCTSYERLVVAAQLNLQMGAVY